MNSKKINLEFKDHTVTHISGNDYGNKIYVEQVEKIFDGKTKTIVIFPEFIKGVSISFIQGFIRKPILDFNKEIVMDLIDFHSEDDFLNKRLERSKRY